MLSEHAVHAVYMFRTACDEATCLQEKSQRQQRGCLHAAHIWQEKRVCLQSTGDAFIITCSVPPKLNFCSHGATCSAAGPPLYTRELFFSCGLSVQ